MSRLLFLAGGYSCSWMVTNDPGVTLPPHRGRVSGTQGQRWWVLLLLGTAGPPTPVPIFPRPFSPQDPNPGFSRTVSSAYVPNILTSLGRDLVRYGGRQMRCINKVLFLPFYQCFADTIYAMR